MISFLSPLVRNNFMVTWSSEVNCGKCWNGLIIKYYQEGTKQMINDQISGPRPQMDWVHLSKGWNMFKFNEQVSNDW